MAPDCISDSAHAQYLAYLQGARAQAWTLMMIHLPATELGQAAAAIRNASDDDIGQLLAEFYNIELQKLQR